VLLQYPIDPEDRREVELHFEDIAAIFPELGDRGVFTISSDRFPKRFDFGLELVIAEAGVRSFL